MMNKQLSSTLALVFFLGFVHAQVDSLSLLSTNQALDSIASLSRIHWNDSERQILNTETDNVVIGQWDPTRRLQGRTAGLNVTANTYSPGSSTKITFRGLRSIANSNQPLILLNGMPINNGEWNNTASGTDQSNRFMDIDPHIIESIDFIKGMSARAKYGIVGANGVLSIKTKRGFKSDPRIIFSSTLSMSQVSNLPELQYEYSQGRTIGGVQLYEGPETGQGFSWGAKMSDLRFDGDSEYPFDMNGNLSADFNGLSSNIYDPLDFFTTAISHNQSLQILGGYDKISYMMTGSYNSQRGPIETNQYNRLNLGASVSYQPLENLELNIKANISNSNAQRSQTGSNLRGIMLGLLRTPVSFDNSNGTSNPIDSPQSYTLSDGSHRSYRQGIYDNPYWSLNRNKHNDEVSRQMFQVSGKYSLFSNLELQFNAGLDSYSDFRIGGIDRSSSNISNTPGNAYERNLEYTSQNLDLSAKYKLIDNENITLNTTIAYNFNQTNETYKLDEGTELVQPNRVSLSNVMVLEELGSFYENIRTGGLLVFDLQLKNYLELNGSVRQDYSNKFGSETNGFLSYGLGFDFSIFKFINQDQNALPFDVKLNGSYGKFGNEFISGNQFGIYQPAVIGGDGFIGADDSFPVPGIAGVELNSIIRANGLLAESTSGFDFGFDILSRERLRLAILYYNEVSDGVILDRSIAGSSGHSGLRDNVGILSNTGIDINLAFQPIAMQKFAWKIDVNFNKNNNLLEELNSELDEIPLSGFTAFRSVAKVGFPIGVIQGQAFLRNDSDQVLIDEAGWPIVNFEQEIIGDPNPDWTMYINNEFRLGKNISISALLDIKQGGEMYCGTCGTLDYFGKSQNSADQRGATRIFEGVSAINGQENRTSVQLAPADGVFTDYYLVRYGFGGIGEMSIYDASWIRLRNVVLSYDLKNLFGSDLFSEFSFSLFAQNLLLITDYPGIDPETNLTGNSTGFGIDYYNNPGTRTFGINLKATF